MTILNPDHLFDQAERLISAPSAGKPRQVDLRRAISTVYYGIFHFTLALAALADELVGVTQRTTSRYALLYRIVDHRYLKDLCSAIARSSPPQRFQPYCPPSGFGEHLHAYATAVTELQEGRHQADYNPEPSYVSSDARIALATARRAVQRFNQEGPARKKVLLTLLLCPPRS